MATDKQKIEFEQYKEYVSSAEKNSDRRDGGMKLFSGLNSMYLVFAGTTLGVLDNVERLVALLIVCLVGFLTSILFAVKLNSYKNLNSAKYQVIQEMEKNLPFSPYTDEWKILGNGKNKKEYTPLSHIDIVIVKIIGGAYLITGLILLFCNIRIDICFIGG